MTKEEEDDELMDTEAATDSETVAMVAAKTYSPRAS